MSTLSQINHTLFPVAGIRLGTAAAGIKKAERQDLTIIAVDPGSLCSAVFTRNVFCAAPVMVAKRHLQQQAPRYLLINTGNANAGTGEPGLLAATQCCQALAELTGVNLAEVLPFSTGVIGENLPTAKIVAALPAALAALSEQAWPAAASAIMTTDTRPKLVSRQLIINDQPITITGIAKGAGMIKPNMATMLAYIATNAAVSQDVLDDALHRAVQDSFNCISIDGDTSTNDACVLLATGQTALPTMTALETPEGHAFYEALRDVCITLAQELVRDGEGATKFITVNVLDGPNESACRQVAETVAHSPLVKTAFFASDPNWGRILAAVGRSGIDGLDVARISIYLDDVCIVRNGGRADDYTEQRGAAVMQQSDITITIRLGLGDAAITLWTCDLSYDYVRINAEYRT